MIIIIDLSYLCPIFIYLFSYLAIWLITVLFTTFVQQMQHNMCKF